MIERTSGRPLARDAMAYVLAGGRGSRLMELTDRRAKPAVYFGGKSRIIDFALSNAINSGIRRIGVATQYKAHSLIRHMQRAWTFLRPERNESFDILPASQRVSENQWYEGTADAVFQNMDIIASLAPKYMVILAGDHIYKMDYELMLQQHVNS
jgi:glucose-1-phosphate adenylyltransferase